MAQSVQDPERESTKIWGNLSEKNDFLKVPKALCKFHQYLTPRDVGIQLKPRHVALILALAAHKFQNKPLRAYWEEIGSWLGASGNTVRKWAYELKSAGLLIIRPNRGRDRTKDRPGYRNESNTFDLSPFTQLVERAYLIRCDDIARRKKERGE